MPIKLFALNRPREELYKQVETRIEAMFERGLIEEISNVSLLPLSATAAKLIGMATSSIAVSSPDELRALQPPSLAGSDGLIVTADAMFWNYRTIIIALASSVRIPALYPEREYADDGGLIAYGANVPDHFRQAAGYVDRILRGDKAGDLPINASSRLDFVVNLRTARELGLAISPDFLSSANEVIE